MAVCQDVCAGSRVAKASFDLLSLRKLGTGALVPAVVASITDGVRSIVPEIK